jgi:cytochrome c-type biogenesis protein CcmE
LSKRKIWIIAGSGILTLGLIYGAFVLFFHGGSDSLTVSEFRAEAASLEDQAVEVKGKVVAGSVNWNESTKTIEFVLADNKESLTVVYEGVVPDHFKPGVEVTVAGKYRSDDIFEAGSFGGQSILCAVCH